MQSSSVSSESRIPEEVESFFWPERIEEARLFELLNFIGNHEAKLLTAALLVSQPDRWFTRVGLRKETAERQGDVPSWVQDHSVLFGYCKNGLEPAEIAEKGEVIGARGKEVEAYRGKKEKAHEVLAVSGALLAWSLKYPELSVQDVFGSTNSPSQKKRSPETRVRILQELITAPDTPTKLEITLSIGEQEDYAQTSMQLSAMRDRGILHIDQKNMTYNPVLRVNSALAIGRTVLLKNTTAENQALYSTLAQLEGEDLSLEDLLAKVSNMNDSLDLSKIRQKIVTALNGDGSLPGLQRIEPSGMANQRFTRVSIEERVKVAIQELLESLSSLDDHNTACFYAKEALNIINSKESCAQLMAKAREASVQRIGAIEGKEGLERRVKRIIERSGPLTLATITAEINGERNRSLSTYSVSVILRHLVDSGELVKVVQKINPTKKRKTAYFNLPTETQ